jgi:hypothetical protein
VLEKTAKRVAAWLEFFAQYYKGDQSKEDEMGGACGVHGGGEGCIQHFG